ncbi:hypothetical protein [Lysobacter sp. CA199]|uniref:hypothetical protein n=1 Tax=Lysobacter sp. CA199 TaxID=3455608 RepID=UPI003F8D09F5
MRLDTEGPRPGRTGAAVEGGSRGFDVSRNVGLDAQRYSRTNSHGTVKLSWNLLTGDRVIERGEPNASGQGDAAIVYAPAKRDSKPLYMETTPNPDELL